MTTNFQNMSSVELFEDSMDFINMIDMMRQRVTFTAFKVCSSYMFDLSTKFFVMSY